MALLWKKQTPDSCYEVRTAGNTVRLYTDGVFHSQYNKRTRISGGIWDLLMFPVFFHPLECFKRILVLGVGGGAVMRMYLDHLQLESISGVELDACHLDIAKQYFGLNDPKVKLIQQDAVRWMTEYKGPPFDLIVEDLFGEHQGEPVRAIQPDKQWTSLLKANLSDDGMIIANFLSKRDICQSAYQQNTHGGPAFISSWVLTDQRYENHIAVFSRQTTSLSELKVRIRQASVSQPAFRKSASLFQARRLRCG